MTMQFENIPLEMRVLRQWMCAGKGLPRLPTGEPNPDYKAPISPRTGLHGSITDKRDWGSLDECIATGLPLVGFVFTKDDPFAVIDFDTYKASGDNVRAFHSEVIRLCDSYLETSQSGEGTHLIGYGKLEAGVKHEPSSLELYSSERFMICTGWTQNHATLIDIQKILDWMVAGIGVARGGASLDWRDLGEGEAEQITDQQIVDMASNASNGIKFARLWNGDMSDYQNDHSRADSAMIEFLAFYTKNNAQVIRLFMQTALGQRDKAKRKDYLPRTIADVRRKLASEEIPLVDTSMLNVRVEHAKRGEETRVQAPADITFPPGLVGDVARYVLASSTRPVNEIALATAIGIVAGICARNFNISATGLNQYILLLAKTGTGKEAAQSAIDRLFNAVEENVPAASRFVGPANFASGQALVKRFQTQTTFLSVFGEFGQRMQALTTPRANSAEKMLLAALLDIYAKSGWGQKMRPSVYSDKEKDTDMVHAPALTILAETAPEPFFATLDESVIQAGFVPRFFAIEYKGERPSRNKNAQSTPPPELVSRVTDLCSTVLQMEQNNICTAVAMDDDARGLLDDFDEHVDKMMRGALTTQRELWNRAHLKALRLSALVAVGVNHHAPTISSDHAIWAIEMVKRDVGVFLERFETGDVGDGDGKRRAEIIRVVNEWIEGKRIGSDMLNYSKLRTGVIPLRYIHKRCSQMKAFNAGSYQSSTKNVDTMLDVMVRMGELERISPKQSNDEFKTKQALYCLGENWGNA